MARMGKVDSTALVQSNSVGPLTEVEAFSRILHEAEVGYQCRIGRYCMIAGQARILDGAVIEDYVTIPAGVTVEERAVVGSHVAFADNHGQYPAAGERTLIGQGCRIGAGAVLLRGITVGHYALVGPGSLVVQNVPDYGRVSGNPACQDGWICACGRGLALPSKGDKHTTCSCGRSYRLLDDQLSKYTQLGNGEP